MHCYAFVSRCNLKDVSLKKEFIDNALLCFRNVLYGQGRQGGPLRRSSECIAMLS